MVFLPSLKLGIVYATQQTIEKLGLDMNKGERRPPREHGVDKAKRR